MLVLPIQHKSQKYLAGSDLCGNCCGLHGVLAVGWGMLERSQILQQSEGTNSFVIFANYYFACYLPHWIPCIVTRSYQRYLVWSTKNKILADGLILILTDFENLIKCRMLVISPNIEIKARPTPWTRDPTDILFWYQQ